MNPMTMSDTGMNDAHVQRLLHGVDLNLLAAFDTLTSTGSVTAAAAMAGVTQSAMSHTLRRLRELLGDPVLVRARGGMVLTPRAEALRIPLRAALGDLARALARPPSFDPSLCSREFRLVAPDLFDILVLPALLHRLAELAPQVDVAVVPMRGALAEKLETGDVDLAVAPVLLDDLPFDRRSKVAPDLQQRTLFRDKLRCFVRAGHPAISARRRMTLKTFTRASHVLVSPHGDGLGVVDRFLEHSDLSRRVAVRVPQFGTALAIVSQTDLVLTAPSALAATEREQGRVVSLAPPIALPEHAVTMVWHPRFSEDPAHRWFRNLVAEVAGALAS